MWLCDEYNCCLGFFKTILHWKYRHRTTTNHGTAVWVVVLLHGGVVVSPVASHLQGQGLESFLWVCVCGVCILSPCLVGFLPQLKRNIHIWTSLLRAFSLISDGWHEASGRPKEPC